MNSRREQLRQGQPALIFQMRDLFVRAFAVCATVGLFWIAWIGTGEAQQRKPYNPCDLRYAINPPCKSMAEQAVEALNSLAKAAGAKANLSLEIDQARQRFFREYPKGPHRTQAEAEFANLLFQKDLYYLFVSTYVGGGGSFQQSQAADQIDVIFGFGSKLDGGIRPFSRGYFDDWTAEFYKKAMAPDPNTIGRPGIEEFFRRAANMFSTAHFEETQNEYERYRLARDWAEFSAAGINITDDPKAYLTILFAVEEPWRSRTGSFGDAVTPMDRAAKYYQTMANVFGEPSLIRAAKVLMSAPKDQNAMIRLSGQSPQMPYDAFFNALTHTDKRSSVLTIILRFDESDLRSLQRANTSYKYLVAAYGEKAVFEAADRVWAESSGQGRIEGGDARIFGMRQWAALQDQCAVNDPRGFVRALLAYHDGTVTQQGIDAAYAKLVTTYGQRPVDESGQHILSFLKDELLPDVSDKNDKLKSTYFGFGLEAGSTWAYSLLMGLLDGSKTLPRAITDADLVDNPAYSAIARFPIGTVVTLAETHWQHTSQVKPVYAVTIRTEIIKSVTTKSVTVKTGEWIFHRSDNSAVTLANEYAIPSKLLKTNPVTPTNSEEPISKQSGEEVLDVNGRTIRCHWQSERYKERTITEWTSDEIPGGLVRRQTLDASGWITERLLQPFQIDKMEYAMTWQPNALFDVKSVSGTGPKVEPIATTMNLETTDRVSNRITAKLPLGSHISVVTSDAIDVTGVNSGRQFRAELEEALQDGSSVILPKGTAVFLKVRKQSGGGFGVIHISISVDYAFVNGEHVSLSTNEISKTIRTNVAQPASSNTRNILGGIITIRVPKQSGSSEPREVPAQTRLTFRINE